jgi:tripartite-type tricarboxylate transporter receptor subunit TctC
MQQQIARYWARAALAPLVALATAVGGPAAHGQQDFPTRPVTVIVANAAGGGSDISMRVVQAKTSEMLGRQLIVDIRAGGNSLIGTRAVAVAPPDGYTLGITEPAFLVNPALMRDWHFDPVKDFTPVVLISVTPMILAVPAAMPVKNLQELVAYARANPGRLNYGSPGTGNAGHLAIEQMRNQFGLR